MDLTGDDLAGIVDLFGGLTPAELDEALDELAYRRGVDAPDEATVEAAVASYALFEYDRGDGERLLLVPGPAAFPTLPDGAEDLPHILDVESREIDRSAAGAAALEHIEREAEADLDADRRERLLDLTYDLEAWAPVEAGDLRDRLARE
jgi:hypothetical protein